MIWLVMMQIPGNLSLRHPVISTVLTVRSQVLEEIAAVEDLYVAHTKAAIDSLGASDDAAAEDTDAKATDDSADDAQADDAQADDAAETTADTAEADAE